MKYLQVVMADYIKSLMYDQTDKNEKAKEPEENPITPTKGMGDFDYSNFPQSTQLDPEDNFEKALCSNKTIIKNIESELAENFKNQKCLQNRMDEIEQKLHKRQKIYELFKELYNDQTTEIDKFSNKMKKYNESIDHHEEVLASWQCLINDIRKLPGELD